MNISPKTNFKHESKAKIKTESQPKLKSNIETIANKVGSGDVFEDFKSKDGFNIKVEIKDDFDNGELQNGLCILETLKCTNDIKVENEVKEGTKSRYLHSKPQTPENSQFALEIEMKPKDFKVKLNDELMDDESDHCRILVDFQV